MDSVIRSRVESLCQQYNLPIPSRSQTIGRLGEVLAYSYLKKERKSVIPLCLGKSPTPYDYRVGRFRYEIKTAIASNGVYRLTFVKNRKRGKDNFDFILAVLLPSPISKPIFFRIEASHIRHLTGLHGNLARFNQYLYTKKF